MASPERRGWAARRDQRRPGSSGARTDRAQCNEALRAAELRAPRRALGGSAGHSRRRGKAHQTTPPRQRGAASIDAPCDRHRRPRPGTGLGAAQRPRARSRSANRDAPRRQARDKNAPLNAAGQHGGVRAGLWASRRRATAAQACRRGQIQCATPGGSAAPAECAHHIPRSIRHRRRPARRRQTRSLQLFRPGFGLLETGHGTEGLGRGLQSITGDPARTGEMAVPATSREVGIRGWIDTEDRRRAITPHDPGIVGVEQLGIGQKMLAIVENDISAWCFAIKLMCRHAAGGSPFEAALTRSG